MRAVYVQSLHARNTEQQSHTRLVKTNLPYVPRFSIPYRSLIN